MPVKTEYAYPLKIRGKVTVAAYASEWLTAHSLARTSREVYGRTLEKHIIPALGVRAMADVTAADIRSLFREMEHDGASKALLAKVKTVMSAMFQTAAEDRLVAANVVRGVRYTAATPKRRRALTADEWLAVRRYLTGQHRLFADIVMTTGARIEEIRGMTSEDIKGSTWHVCRVRSELRVDGHAEFITVDKTKTGKSRDIKMDPALAKRIKRAGPGRVFTDIRRDVYRKHWRRACKAAGLGWYPAPRDLRRTYASLAREGGAALDVIRQQLGHSRISTTDGYLAESPAASTEALEAVQRMLRNGGSEMGHQ